MAVPKTTATRCRDRAYKHCTNNPIPTSFFHAQYRLPVILQHKEICHVQKKRCRDGVICAVFVCPVSTPSCCGFWHCHPYIPVHFWKMFYLLVCILLHTDWYSIMLYIHVHVHSLQWRYIYTVHIKKTSHKRPVQWTARSRSVPVPFPFNVRSTSVQCPFVARLIPVHF